MPYEINDNTKKESIKNGLEKKNFTAIHLSDGWSLQSGKIGKYTKQNGKMDKAISATAIIIITLVFMGLSDIIIV